MASGASSESRGQWGSTFGFVMAAAGSAVGLGNIWRFPYLTGQNGGGAFVFVYILCVVLIGMPLLFNEIALGRKTGQSPVGAFQINKTGKFWLVAPILSILVSFVVLSYYSVIAGWTIGYIYTSITSTTVVFSEFIATPEYVIPLTAFFLIATVLIVLGGIAGGIEKASKILMPMLLGILVLIIIRSVTLPGATEGIVYFLKPDFSKINSFVVLAALGQAFFSMSVGWGIMVTYGSYFPKSNNIVTSSLWVGGMDTMVALMGGLMVFPAVFAFGKSPEAGPTLVFQVLPEVFTMMPGGTIVGALFFLLLCIAALTSSISMLEVPVSYFIDNKKWNRKNAAIIVAVTAMALSIPAALSNGGSKFFTEMSLNFMGSTKTGFLDIMDFFFGTLSIVIVCLMMAIYTGWIIKPKDIADEIALGSNGFTKKTALGFSFHQLWIFFIKFVCPIVMILVLLNMLGVFGTPGQGH